MYFPLIYICTALVTCLEKHNSEDKISCDTEEAFLSTHISLLAVHHCDKISHIASSRENLFYLRVRELSVLVQLASR